MARSDYRNKLADCDVIDKQALESFRAKRSLWLSWIEHDADHAIWEVLHMMVWRDASFRALVNFVQKSDDNALHNSLLGEAFLDGHVALQVLAIRRLFDDGRNDIISLRRLVKDIKRNAALFTRENYVCFDGLPYDFQAVQRAEWANITRTSIWVDTEGPLAWGTSERMHGYFDRVCGTDPQAQGRDDKIPRAVFDNVESALIASGADELVKRSHVYLAHAGGPKSRVELASLFVTTNKISAVIRAFCRVTEAISTWIIGEGGRSGTIMPVAQFNQFEHLERQIIPMGDRDEAFQLWHQLSDERNAYLNGIEPEALMKPGGLL